MNREAAGPHQSRKKARTDSVRAFFRAVVRAAACRPDSFPAKSRSGVKGGTEQ